MSLADPLSMYQRKPHRFPHSLGFSRYALEFDGNNWIRAVDSASLDITGKITIELVYTPATIVGTYGLVSKSYAANICNYALYQFNTNLSFEIYDAAYQYVFVLGAIPSANRRYLIQVTLDETVDTVEIYVNLLLVGSTNVFTWNMITNNRDLYIAGLGGAANPPGFRCKGKIDEVRLYSKVLTRLEREHNALNYHRPVTDSLALWYRMEEGSGLAVADLSGNGNTGLLETLAAPPSWVLNKKWGLRAEANL